MPLRPLKLNFIPKTTTTITSSSASSTSNDQTLARVYLARSWRTPRLLLALLSLETALTIAALALFGIADPDLYRTKLWADGYLLGYNSSPDGALLAAANHVSFSTPLCWSQFTTTWNMVISVLSMFILLVKVVMWVMKVFWPLVSVGVHAAVLALYVVSLHAQLARDVSDPLHENRGVPWYLRRGACGLVETQGHYGYCMQARASVAVTVLMVVFFVAYIVLSIWSSFPTKNERGERLADAERGRIAMYKPERSTTVDASATQQWGEKLAMGYLQMPRTPGVGGNGQMPLATPRTVAFQTLDGALVPGKRGGGSGSLPFRERYGGPDGR
ncbi:hypothetical protein MBLNU457_3747t1 [Dothideomycetes sp. NU457]